MILAIASGKGGTGKTTLAVNLARVMEKPVFLLDCDVEEPNAHLFLKGFLEKEEIVTVPIPQVDASLCDACGQCSAFCQFNAIVSLKNQTMVFPELCHSCGGCVAICPQKAIKEVQHRIGVVEISNADTITLVTGRLDVGVAMAPPLIRHVLRHAQNQPLVILDAPPGTSCPVVATVRAADFTILITEPTPFGLCDLGLAVSMLKEVGVPFGVAVNRVGIGDNRVHEFCKRENIPILLEIPDDRRIAEAYSRGNLIVDVLPEYTSLFQGLLNEIANMKQRGEK